MKINVRSNSVWLFIILIIASFLRLWNLSTNPPHLSPDEAALGYNAYSILKTGRDEYGEVMPVIFKSFGDYKPGLYVYTTVPFVAVFGLNEWGVRLPSASLGIVSVFLLYLICSKISVQLPFKHKQIFPVTASFLLAIAPWHIHFSRGAWEINLSLTLTLAGIYFFLKSREKTFFITISAFFFALTLLAYQGAKLSTSLVLLALAASFLSHTLSLFKKQKKYIGISCVVGFLIALPILLSFMNGQTGRLSVFSVFSYPRPEGYLQDFLEQGNEQANSISYYLFHPESINFLRGIMGRWFNHYSGRFLFFEGDWQNPKHSAPYSGMFTLSDILFFLPGLYVLARFFTKPEMRFIGIWLLLAPLPAALSRDQIHAVRAYNLVIPIVFVLSFGMHYIFEYVRSLKRPFQISAMIFLLSGYFFSYLYFLDLYFVHNKYHNARSWDYGLKQIVETIVPIKDNYPLIKVQQSFAQPYIYFLFYGKYDPATYQKTALLVPSDYKNDVGHVISLDNIFFVPINWPQNRGEHGVLFAGDEIRIPPSDSSDPNLFDIKNDIYFPNGERAYRVLEVR